jgi:xanthine/uracil/vitamin C permease (AzgA family)
MKIKLARGRPREAHPLMYVVAALFVLTFVWADDTRTPVLDRAYGI